MPNSKYEASPDINSFEKERVDISKIIRVRHIRFYNNSARFVETKDYPVSVLNEETKEMVCECKIRKYTAWKSSSNPIYGNTGGIQQFWCVTYKDTGFVVLGLEGFKTKKSLIENISQDIEYSNIRNKHLNIGDKNEWRIF